MFSRRCRQPTLTSLSSWYRAVTTTVAQRRSAIKTLCLEIQSDFSKLITVIVVSAQSDWPLCVAYSKAIQPLTWDYFKLLPIQIHFASEDCLNRSCFKTAMFILNCHMGMINLLQHLLRVLRICLYEFFKMKIFFFAVYSSVRLKHRSGYQSFIKKTFAGSQMRKFTVFRLS